MPNNPTPQSTAKTPKLRFPDFKDPWIEKKLGEVSKILRGCNLSKSDIDSSGEHLCILYGELFTKYHERATQILSKTNSILGAKGEYGDVLMPTSDVTPIGLATATSLLVSNVQIGGDVNIIRPSKSLFSCFLSYYLNFNKEAIIKLVSGSTIKHIYTKDIVTLDIPLPTLPEQTKIAEFLTAVDDKIQILDNQKKQLELYKKGLLQAIFPDSNNRGGGENR